MKANIVQNYVKMRTEEKILELVANETGVPSADIVSRCRRFECVEARCLFVVLCVKCGVCLSNTGRFIGITRQAATYLIATHEQRMTMRNYACIFHAIVKKIASN